MTTAPFVNMIKPLSNLALTENWALAYAGTTDARLDFFYSILPDTQKEKVFSMAQNSWQVDKLDTLKIIFHLGAVRFGKADSKHFQNALYWLYQNHPKTLLANLSLVSETGYWKHLLLLLQDIHEEPQVERMLPATPKIGRKGKGKGRRAGSTLLSQPNWPQLGGMFGLMPVVAPVIPVAPKKKGDKKSMQEENRIRAEEARKKRQVREELRAQKLEKLLTQENYVAIRNQIVSLFVDALKSDMQKMKNKEKISLVGKWAPSPNKSADEKTDIALSIAQAFFGDDSDGKELEVLMRYQKEVLAPLRKYSLVTEVFMSENKWHEIPYNRVASVCLRRSQKLFEKHDKERFEKYLEQVKAGVKTVAAGAITPDVLVKEVLVNRQNELSGVQWQRMVTDLKKTGTLDKCISICDVSGSMSGDPMAAAIALSLLLAEVAIPPWNVVCTFSQNPHFHIIDPSKNLFTKVTELQRLDWQMNTNFQKVFDIILQTAQEAKLSDADMVKHIFVFSDMQFDQCDDGTYHTDHQKIEIKFRNAGYTMPNIIYWNLRDTSTFPTQNNVQGVAMVSGFSQHQMSVFMQGNLDELLKRSTPMDIMRLTLDSMPIADNLKVTE
jgi:hypothetical protein